MKAIIFLVAVIVCMALISVNAHAMSVDYHPEFNGANPIYDVWEMLYGSNAYDNSNAGFTLSLPSDGNSGIFYLNDPKGMGNGWALYVALHNVAENTSSQVVHDPHDLDFFVQCGATGGWYNLTSALNNSWTRGYAIFFLDWNTETMVPYADAYDSPTLKDLYTLSRDCSVGVNGLQAGDWLTASFWEYYGTPEQVCQGSIGDASIIFQQDILTVIDYNMQVIQIFFQVFTLVVVIGAVFGIPLMIYKLIRYVIHEFKGKEKKI